MLLSLVGGAAFSSLLLGGAGSSTLLLLGAACFLPLACGWCWFLLLLLGGAAFRRLLGGASVPPLELKLNSVTQNELTETKPKSSTVIRLMKVKFSFALLLWVVLRFLLLFQVALLPFFWVVLLFLVLLGGVAFSSSLPFRVVLRSPF